MRTHTVTFSLTVRANCANTHCSQPCVCVSLCARMCAYCGSPNCKQAVLSHVCVWLSVPFVGLFEFVCAHLCFSMRERELEWDGDKESISLYPGAWIGPKWKALDMMGRLSPALVSHSHQSGSVPHTGWASISVFSVSDIVFCWVCIFTCVCNLHVCNTSSQASV